MPSKDAVSCRATFHFGSRDTFRISRDIVVMAATNGEEEKTKLTGSTNVQNKGQQVLSLLSLRLFSSSVNTVGGTRLLHLKKETSTLALMYWRTLWTGRNPLLACIHTNVSIYLIWSSFTCQSDDIKVVFQSREINQIFHWARKQPTDW